MDQWRGKRKADSSVISASSGPRKALLSVAVKVDSASLRRSEKWYDVGPVARLLFFFSLATLQAQWLNYPSPGTPRTKEGKPNLKAKSPRVAGKPDLSGVWQVEPPEKGEIERILGRDSLTVGLVPGDDLTMFSKYFFNIFADFTPEQAPIRPEALAIMRNRPKDYAQPDERCLPEGIPRAELVAFPFKIVQTPQQLVLMYETDNTRRQIYTDGRKLPPDPSPAWLGYSVGRWEGDTLVVDTAGFNDQGLIDGDGHPQSEQLRIQERFRRIDFGHMELQITIDDPKMYTKPITFKVTQLLMPDSDILEFFCNENEKDRAHIK